MAADELEALVKSLGAGHLESEKVRLKAEERAAAEAEEAAAHAAVAREKLTPVPEWLLDLSVPDKQNENHSNHAAQREESIPGQVRDAVLLREVTQHRAVEQLAATFCKLTAEYIGKKWFQHFEMWLFARRVECKRTSEAVLPVNVPPCSLAHQELKRKLVASGLSQNLASSICIELDGLPGHLKKRIKVPAPPSIKVKVSPCKESTGGVSKLRLTCLGVSLEINKLHLDKLRILHAHSSKSTAQHETVFTHNAMRLLLRYSSLQGTHFRGGGFQAAVHPEVLDTLKKWFNTQQECFASPFNCRWPSYCSMCYDTDAPFGSCGDFFRFRPTSGSFEANPPFDKAFVSKMASHMMKLLNQAEGPLMFIVIIPAWQGEDCWAALDGSHFCQERLLLPAGQHGYCEGSQHNRANQFRVASTATSVFFLQNESATRSWPVTAESIAEITAAFKPKTGSTNSSLANKAVPRKRSATMMISGDFGGKETLVREMNGPCQVTVCDLEGVREQDVGEDEDPVVYQLDKQAPQGLQRKRKRKTKSSVASHTGKYADEKTLQAVLNTVTESVTHNCKAKPVSLEDENGGQVKVEGDMGQRVRSKIGNFAKESLPTLSDNKPSANKGNSSSDVVTFPMSSSQRSRLRGKRKSR